VADAQADYWTMNNVADHWGVKIETVRTYRKRGRGELPDEDRMFGQSPAWKPSTIIAFQRPGKGARTDLLSSPPKRKPPAQEGPLVYYLLFADRIKIGTTTNLTARMRSIPHDELLATEPGSLDVERRRHREFAHLRITGEWFRTAADLFAHIEALKLPARPDGQAMSNLNGL
jgi:hypothetical protein